MVTQKMKSSQRRCIQQIKPRSSWQMTFEQRSSSLVLLFTKALPEDRFKYLVRRIGMRCLTPADLEVLTNETA
ncbi:hypothetical protein Tco_0577932 [Tanacetum coccineum]